MILVYNFLLFFLFLLLLPLIIPVVMIREKYRGRSLERLGLRTPALQQQLSVVRSDGPVIWMHALSVGEVTSALPLVKAIRDDIPQAVIVFSVATRSGRQIADSLIAPHADSIVYSPFDLWFSVQRYISAINADLFILVETDFWPNWLYQLKTRKIPAMLVNGRVSEKSFAAYRRLHFFFKPMFRSFSLLAMQTGKDAETMVSLGIEPEKVISLGNLKYDLDTENPASSFIDRSELAVPEDIYIWVCGSTHPGEEELLFSTFKEIAKDNNLYLILAPRDISRGDELASLAEQLGLEARRRQGNGSGGDVLILDTIGELASCYRLAKVAFVGGSLVAQGGHNPIEPAAFGVPVLFGSHMEDFSEIADDLVACGGARTVTGGSLTSVVSSILQNDAVHDDMARAARGLVEQYRGGVHQHLQALHRLLEK